MTQDSKSQIYAAAIGAGVALAIAVGGFLYQTGLMTGHLERIEVKLDHQEQRMDMVYDEVVEQRVRTARIEEQLRGPLASRNAARPDQE